jgi:hypothetical protein
MGKENLEKENLEKENFFAKKNQKGGTKSNRAFSLKLYLREPLFLIVGRAKRLCRFDLFP